MQQLWKVLIWSLRAAYTGNWPDSDVDGNSYSVYPESSFERRMAGKPLAGGHFLVTWSLKGDLEYFAKGLHLRHYACNEFCEFCRAHSNPRDIPRLWTNFSAGAAWKTSLFSVAEWRAMHAVDMHWLFREFDFLSQHNVDPDELHVVYMGVVAYMLGSVLWVLAYKCLPGDPKGNLSLVWGQIAAAYRSLRTPTQYSSLNLNMFTDSKQPRSQYPKLKGRGAEMKDLVKPLLLCWEHFRSDKYEFDTIRDMLRSQVELQEVLSAYSRELFLPETEADKVIACVDDILFSYSKLANKADREGGDAGLLWNVTPKFHWFWHWGQRAPLLNPRRSSCCLDEDFVGDVKEVVGASTASTPMQQVPLKVMEKIVWQMHFVNMPPSTPTST